MPRQRKKLPISCDAADCANNLHCFNATKEMKENNKAGPCWKCGVELVDWQRIRRRNIADVNYTFRSLKFETVRHFFWHRPINLRAKNHALRKGKHLLRETVRNHLRHAIGAEKPYHDGSQTTMDENAPTAMPFGQHATATCCRKCLEFWHDIPQGSELTEQQLAYCSELVCLFIEDCVPEIRDEPQSIPPIRRHLIEV